MSARLLALLYLGALPAALAAPPAVATDGDQSARANGPAALAEAPSGTAALPPPILIGPPLENDPPGIRAVSRDPSPVASTPFTPPPVEMRSLGKPLPRPGTNGPGDDQAGIVTSSLPRWLDPREHEATRVVASLLAVVGLIILTKVMITRRGGPGLAGGARPSGVLEVLARYPVGRGQFMVLLKLGRRVLLMHQSGQTMTTLSDIGDPDEVAALLGRMEAGASGRAAGWFRTLLTRYESEHERAERRLGDASGAAAPGGEVIDLTRGRRRPGRRLRHRSVQP